jgi:SAM-dependent MidA family methyltransferase
MSMSLENKIKSIIKRSQYITIADYMRLCLNDPEQGYYIKKQAVGKEGDFITAPEISQLFGEIIAVYIASKILERFSAESSIQIIEVGAGRGVLISDILRVLQKIPEIYNKIEVHIVEINEVLREEQKLALAKFDVKSFWHSDMLTLPAKPSIFVGNEFFDALPIHQFKMQNNEWHEVCVSLGKNDELQYSLNKTENLRLIPANLVAPENGYFEISPETIFCFSIISNFIKQNGGLGIFFDYGYFHYNFEKTFQAVKNHKYSNPLEFCGEADLTAHVNFKTMIDLANRYSLKILEQATQGEFLVKYGIELRAKKLMENKDEITQKKILQDLNRLIAKDQMGEVFKCFVVEN